MEYKWRIIFMMLLIAIICSCNKSPSDHPEYIGSWNNGCTFQCEQDVDISSDGKGSYYYWHEGSGVSGSGSVHITKSHVKIGDASFCILIPPTHIDSINLSGQWVSWEMKLQEKSFLTGEVATILVFKK